MDAIDTILEEDEAFMDRYKDIEWVDEVDQYQCTRCQKVLVQHCISNCDHKFCFDCKKLKGNGNLRWRCPRCQGLIKNMRRQDYKFRDKVFELRLHCPNQKYGCGHICQLKDIKEHLRGCEYTKESALSALCEGEITAEMVERMLSNQLSRLRNEMREQMAEMRNACKARDEEQNEAIESSRKLRVEVGQMKEKMSEMEEKRNKRKMKLRTKFILINERVDGVKSDLTVETTRLRNEIKEMQNNQPMRSGSLNSESVSLAVEKNKAKILELKGKTEAYNEMMNANYKNTNELIHQFKNKVKKEFKAKDIKVEQTMSELKTAQEEKWAETKKILDATANRKETELKLRDIKAEVEAFHISNKEEIMKEIDRKIDSNNKETNEKNAKIEQRVELMKQEVTEESQRYTDGKIITMEKTTEDNQQQFFNLETFILLKNPQMDCFALAENKCNFQPDFTWKISELKKKLKQTTFEIKSEAFTWAGYPVQAQTKIELKQYDHLYMSLCVKEINQGKDFDLKLIPHVHYVLRDQSGNTDTKHRSRSNTYLFAATFKNTLRPTFELSLTHKSMLTDSVYNVDDSIVIKVYVEPPSMAQMVHSYDGTLVWAIDHYRKRKQMAKEGSVFYQECPYFYTAPKGYRVRVRMWLDGWGQSRRSRLAASIIFLTGEFDADLSGSFPHTTTITLFNRKDPRRNIIKTADRDIQTRKNYFVNMCCDEEIENVIENDTVFFKVTIKPKN